MMEAEKLNPFQLQVKKVLKCSSESQLRKLHTAMFPEEDCANFSPELLINKIIGKVTKPKDKFVKKCLSADAIRKYVKQEKLAVDLTKAKTEIVDDVLAIWEKKPSVAAGKELT